MPRATAYSAMARGISPKLLNKPRASSLAFESFAAAFYQPMRHRYLASCSRTEGYREFLEKIIQKHSRQY